jgi:type I restriction enzyme S subunit
MRPETSSISPRVPKGWDIAPLGTVAAVRSGGTPSRSTPEYWGGDIPWVTTTEVKGETITTAHEFITRRGLERSAARLESPGTILIALYGQGPTRGRVGILGIEAATNQACAAIAPRSGLLAKFLFYFLNGNYDTIRGLSNKGSQDNLSGALVKQFPIAIPSPPEQRAIAEALSDVDELLGALDALIAKKRGIKQGAMQQLLTGKTRLPGFGGKWETKRLGDHVSFLRHGVNSRAELTSDGSVKYLHYGDIHTTADVYLEPCAREMPTLPTDCARTLDRLQDGDLVLVDASEDLDGVGKSVEIKGMRGVEVVSGLHTITARFDKTVLADGFKAYLQFCPAFRNHLRRLAAGTKVYATNRAHIATVEMQLPGTDEQTGIATVLSDMDAAIIALEARRDKTRALKQGMMQKLLTGRVRLVGSEKSDAISVASRSQ